MVPGEGAGVVVLTNRSDVKAMRLVEALMNTLAGTLWRTDPTAALPFRSACPPGTARELAASAGRYAFRKGEATIEAGERVLSLETPSRYDGPVQRLTLRRVGPDCVLDLALCACVPFCRGATGHVDGFGSSGYGYRRIDRPARA